MTNKTFDQMMREHLITELARCTPGQQDLFRRMYSGGKPHLSSREVVEKMPYDKLDWAMTQVENTLAKNRNR